MKNVLIPSDFSLASIDLAARAVPALEDGKINIIFFHAFSVPTDIHDLFDNRAAKLMQECVSDSFRQSCRRLSQQFPGKIRNVFIRFMQGDSRRVFEHFCDANEIDLIVYPYGHIFTPVHERSIDPVNLFRKTDIPMLRDLAGRVRKVAQEYRVEPEQRVPAFYEDRYSAVEESVFIKSKQYVVKK